MQDNAKDAVPGGLNEIELRDKLRTLRKHIPDTPGLNPIVSVAFELSRRLEASEITFEALRALATRLMDRAFVQRARHLREGRAGVLPAPRRLEHLSRDREEQRDGRDAPNGP